MDATLNLRPAPAEAAASPAGTPRPIVFHAPGLKPHRTTEYTEHNVREFVSISVTGTACALGCDHCGSAVLKGMTALPRMEESLFELCAKAKAQGARGVLISGGSDAKGRVPLLAHIPDMIRARKELGLKLRVHPGLPDEATCEALGEADLDGAMVDVIGHEDTIRKVYHLKARPADYEAVLANLERHGIPTVPHIILGLHYGRMLGEWNALEMIARHPPKLLVLVLLMPLSGTPMANVAPPEPAAIGEFFRAARAALPERPVMLGCARPLGPVKREIDRLAIDAGLDGIAYPAEGTVAYAKEHSRIPQFVNACCGVTW